MARDTPRSFLRRLPPPWLLAVLGVLGLTLIGLAIAFLEGDLPEGFGQVGIFARHFIFRFGVPGSLILLYLEESGVPLPVPGDAYVLYLGHAAEDSRVQQIAAALGIVIVVSAGATNMFLLSRAWGERLLGGRLGHTLHITESRLATAERWLRRWGPLLIIFGRHVPGFRIPITVVAGTFKVPYALFIPCVAVSTSLWVTAWFLLQARFGREIGRFAQGHRWTYLIAVAVVVFLVASLIVRAVRYRPPADGVRR